MAFFFSDGLCKDVIQRVLREYGFVCNLKEVPKPKGLPVYMVANRGFIETKIEGVNVLFVAVRHDEKFGIEALRNQIEKYELATWKPIAFLFEQMTDVQRKKLIEERIPFLAAPAFVYLPFLGVALQLRKNRVKKEATLRETLTPQTQRLFLYMLYNVKDSFVSKAKAASDTGLNPMAVTRGSRDLEQLGLIKMERDGRSVQMTCALKGRELVDKAIPYLANPIQKNIIVLKDDVNETYSRAGETALSAATILGPPRIEVVACAKGATSTKTIDYTADANWFNSAELVNVQVWKYDPAPFARDGRVDPVSLYMSLKDSPDERVQQSLDAMMENVEW